MGRVLAISSQVARGHVGLSAIVPALQRLGHDVIALPTILLSNHPGHQAAAGEHVSPDLLRRMLAALETNGWLGSIDAILTGYLPSAEHVRFAIEAIDGVRRHVPHLRVLVDPVLGDEPKGLYINPDAAAHIRDHLIPLADVTTPNAFELSWLTSVLVENGVEAAQAARLLKARHVLATSVPAAGGALSNILIDKTADVALSAIVPHRGRVPNGTGDLMAALYLGHELRNVRRHSRESFARAVAGVDAAIAASAGQGELALAASPAAWADPAPWPLTSL
jgi:pyridoxine kinase